MSKSKVLHHKIPSEQREMSELPTTSTPAASDLEEENFDSAFWEQVYCAQCISSDMVYVVCLPY